ncbi:hypothetical protein ONQ60_24850, partial [Salmonella enterica subsp. enterica serovar Virginia]|nr:hypothetical protein [Salmonella enterica subsp. enterica serovar Virginia]
RFYALSSCSGRILTEKENVCVGISFPRVNKNGAEKIFNAITLFISSGTTRRAAIGLISAGYQVYSFCRMAT